jgi:hypothetical protein
VNKALKVILIIGVCIVLLVIVVGGVGVYYLSQHKQEWLEAGNKVMDEGEKFGRQTDNDGCLAEAITRTKREPGFNAALGHTIFLRACLEASRPSPGFCEVPKRTEFIKSAQWQQQKCQDAGLAADNYCLQLFTQVQQFCEDKQSKQK